MEAVSIWLLAPTAIEADFRFRGLRIADWLTGKMSSREFLVLLRHLEDTSAFKTLAPEPYGRDGNWTEAVQIAAKGLHLPARARGIRGGSGRGAAGISRS
jgi:hypothetical protein